MVPDRLNVYGELRPVIQAVGWLVSASLALGSLWMRLRGFQRVATVLTATGLGIIWSLLADSSKVDLLARLTVYFSGACLICLLVSDFLASVFRQRSKDKASGQFSQSVVGALATQCLVALRIGLAVCGSLALGCAAILLLLHPRDLPSRADVGRLKASGQEEPHVWLTPRAIDETRLGNGSSARPVKPVGTLTGVLTGELPAGWTVYAKTSPYEQWKPVSIVGTKWEIREFTFRFPTIVIPGIVVDFRACPSDADPAATWEDCRSVADRLSIPVATPQAELWQMCSQKPSAPIKKAVPCRIEGVAHHVLPGQEKLCVTVEARDSGRYGSFSTAAYADLRAAGGSKVLWSAQLREGCEVEIWKRTAATMRASLVSRQAEGETCPQGGDIELRPSEFGLARAAR